MLSNKQQQALENPCPNCGNKLQEIGDLADFENNLVSCTNCDYTMFYDGSSMN
jgi:predicted nucleic-acid-binding Zn-ribbon protein